MNGRGESQLDDGAPVRQVAATAASWRPLEAEARRIAPSRRDLCEHLFTIAVLSQAPVERPSYFSAARERTLAWIRRGGLLAASAGFGTALVPAPLPSARRTLTGWTLRGRTRARLTAATQVLLLLATEEDGSIGLFAVQLDAAFELRRLPRRDVTELDLDGVRISPYDRVGSFDPAGVERLGRIAGRLRREIEQALRVDPLGSHGS